MTERFRDTSLQSFRSQNQVCWWSTEIHAFLVIFLCFSHGNVPSDAPCPTLPSWTSRTQSTAPLLRGQDIIEGIWAKCCNTRGSKNRLQSISISVLTLPDLHDVRSSLVALNPPRMQPGSAHKGHQKHVTEQLRLESRIFISISKNSLLA